MGPALLTVAEEQAREELSKQLSLGEQLLAQVDSAAAMSTSQPAVAQLESAADGWYRHTNALLERRFSTMEVSQSFVMAARMRVRSTYDRSVATDLVHLRERLNSRVTFLHGLLDRLSVYNGPAPGLQPVDSSDDRRDRTSPPVTINVQGGIGQLNLSDTVRNIRTEIAAMTGPDTGDLADALRHLTDAVVASAEVEEAHRQELLDNIEVLATAAKEPAHRRRHGQIKAAIAFIASGASAAAKLSTAWQDWEPVISQHLIR